MPIETIHPIDLEEHPEVADLLLDFIEMLRARRLQRLDTAAAETAAGTVADAAAAQGEWTSEAEHQMKGKANE